MATLWLENGQGWARVRADDGQEWVRSWTRWPRNCYQIVIK